MLRETLAEIVYYSIHLSIILEIVDLMQGRSDSASHRLVGCGTAIMSGMTIPGAIV